MGSNGPGRFNGRSFSQGSRSSRFFSTDGAGVPSRPASTGSRRNDTEHGSERPANQQPGLPIMPIVPSSSNGHPPRRTAGQPRVEPATNMGASRPGPNRPAQHARTESHTSPRAPQRSAPYPARREANTASSNPRLRGPSASDNLQVLEGREIGNSTSPVPPSRQWPPPWRAGDVVVPRVTAPSSVRRPSHPTTGSPVQPGTSGRPRSAVPIPDRSSDVPVQAPANLPIGPPVQVQAPATAAIPPAAAGPSVPHAPPVLLQCRLCPLNFPPGRSQLGQAMGHVREVHLAPMMRGLFNQAQASLRVTRVAGQEQTSPDLQCDRPGCGMLFLPGEPQRPTAAVHFLAEHLPHVREGLDDQAKMFLLAVPVPLKP